MVRKESDEKHEEDKASKTLRVAREEKEDAAEALKR